MERKKFIEILRFCARTDTPCEECLEFIRSENDAENGFCLEAEAAKMLEDDAEQLQYADDTIQTLLHEQKETFLKLLPKGFTAVHANHTPSEREYEEGYNTAIIDMIVNVNRWNFKRLDGRKE